MVVSILFVVCGVRHNPLGKTYSCRKFVAMTFGIGPTNILRAKFLYAEVGTKIGQHKRREKGPKSEASVVDLRDFQLPSCFFCA